MLEVSEVTGLVTVMVVGVEIVDVVESRGGLLVSK